MASNAQHTSANDDLIGRFMTFYIDDTLYGIELLYVKEIVSLEQTTVVPSLPHYILGIMNLRGKVVPLIDVRLKLNQPERPYDEKTCVIITLIEDMQVGLIVDSVAEVFSSSDTKKIQPPDPASVGENYINAIMHMEDKVILCLDCDKFFADDLH